MAWNHIYDVNTPAGGDDPKEGDDRIREVKAALQERIAKDHYFPKTGSQVSDVDAGEHKKVTLRVGSAPGAVADKGFVYAKDVDSKAELFYIDEDGNEVQITTGGIVKVPPPTSPLTISGATAFSGTSPTVWTDLDLSSIVGANSAMVMLSFFTSNVDDKYVAIRRNGDTIDYHIEAAVPSGIASAKSDTNRAVVLMCVTDTSGIIEWKTSAAISFTVKVIAYIK